MLATSRALAAYQLFDFLDFRHVLPSLPITACLVVHAQTVLMTLQHAF